MRIIKPYVELITPTNQDAVLKRLEQCGGSATSLRRRRNEQMQVMWGRDYLDKNTVREINAM